MRAVRRSSRRGPWPALLLIACCCAAGASAQEPAESAEGVRVRLSLAGGKSVYRMGEPVRLVLSLTAERGGVHADTTTTKPAHPVDEITLSPDAGAHPWLEEFTGGHRHAPDHSLAFPLSAKPATVELPLNDLFRFDRPGRYTARVKTRRVARTPLVTNEVGFEIVPMSEAEEELEVRRLVAALDAATDWQEEARASEELSYLAGAPSTRAKVRLFAHRQGRAGNFWQNLYYGLFIARDRALALRLLEAEVRDPATEVTQQLLDALATLRALHEGRGARETASDEPRLVGQGPPPLRFSAIKREYLHELAASLARRAGKSQMTAAMTVLSNLPKEPALADALLTTVREILLREFDNLHPFSQEWLLRVYWDKLRDPALAPALEKMWARNREPAGYQVRAAAIRRLLELRPERARQLVVAELRDPESLVEFDVLSALGDATLPEADAALLAQIQKLAPLQNRGDFVHLRHKALLAARFASPAIYDGVLEAYQKWGAKWEANVKGAVLGYLARHDETRAAPLVEQALAETRHGQDLSFLVELTRSHYADAVHALLRKRLEGDDPQAAATAAYIMSKSGPAEGRGLIEARLSRWLKEWGPRAAELDAADADPAAVAQRMVEVNLVEALLRAKSWKLTEQEVERLKRGCLTQRCREHYGFR